MRRGEEFRRRGQECRRLSTQLLHAEHRSFAIELAKAWTALAEYEERKALVQIEAAQVVMAGDGTILLIAQSETVHPPGGAPRVIVTTLSPDRSSRPSESAHCASTPPIPAGATPDSFRRRASTVPATSRRWWRSARSDPPSAPARKPRPRFPAGRRTSTLPVCLAGDIARHRIGTKFPTLEQSSPQ